MLGRFPILYVAEADPELAVMSSGVLAYLVEVMPQANFVVVGSPASAPLFADTPRLTRLLVLDKESRLDWIKLWDQVRHTKWGLVVDMRGSSLVDRLKRTKRAVRGKDAPGVHHVEAAARALMLDETPPPRLFTGDETEAAVAALIPAGEGPILAVGPGADWVGKQWPPDRFVKVAAALMAEDGPMAGGRLMLVGSDTDREAIQTVRSAVPRNRMIELHGKLTPLQTVAALRRADLYIGNDSLWTQLAVAAGVPTLAAFGPSDEEVRGPWGGVTVRGPRSLDEFRALDPNLNQQLNHMIDVPADRVLKAARTMLASRADSGV
ncbi:MAG: glycosyltransferase family 9 protein [Pseudomonadota bacterium]